MIKRTNTPTMGRDGAAKGMPKGMSRDGQPEGMSQRDKNRHGGTKCECCGNDYDKPLEIVQNGVSHYFDCFECAIHMMAPKCAHCGCRILGHGHEAGGSFFCCAHCAQEQGVSQMVDRA